LGTFQRGIVRAIVGYFEPGQKITLGVCKGLMRLLDAKTNEGSEMSTFDEIFTGSVNLILKKEVALVLFEMFADVKQESAVPIRDDAERQAIWNLACLFESALVEPFMPNYNTIIDEAKKRLAP
jgi:hypothetical protein